ncbi:hypothetical protein ACIRVK_22200 [Streptomyces sp. NPDC101152]|uniref:hypothetical protein n=1 Tax=Streptomyces sp. NPDC101152 TaxID=3366116 RepID=UPI0037F35FA8
MPLSYRWDGETLLLAPPAASPTGRNLRATGTARGGIGLTREEGDLFAARTGFDPRELSTPYLYFRITPSRVQAWREADELKGRVLMRDGKWLVAD